MDLYDSIYYSLIGEIEPYAALPWVPNAFAPGEFCDQETLPCGRRPKPSAASQIFPRERSHEAAVVDFFPVSH